MSDYKNILSHTDCLTQEQMQAYLNNTLDKQAIHTVERHLTDCLFCSDAIEGLQLLSAEENEKHLTEIESGIEELLGLNADKVDTASPISAIPPLTTTKIPDTPKLKAKKGSKRISWFAAAGLFFIIFASGLVVFSYINNNTNWFQPDGLVKTSTNAKEIKLEKNKTTGRELETYTLSEDAATETEQTEVLDKNPSRKNSAPKKEIAITKKVAAQREIVARNDEITKNIPSAPSAPPIVSAPKIATKENRLAVVEKEKRDVADLDTKAVSADVASDNFIEDPGLAGAKNTYSQSQYEGKMKDLNNAPAVTKIEKAAEKKVTYSKNSSRQEIDKIQAEEVSKTGKAYLSNYDQGLDAFQKANYKTSIKYLKRALKEKDLANREETIYYLAMAYEKTDNTAKARELYQLLSKSKTYETRAKARMRAMPVVK